MSGKCIASGYVPKNDGPCPECGKPRYNNCEHDPYSCIEHLRKDNALLLDVAREAGPLLGEWAKIKGRYINWPTMLGREQFFAAMAALDAALKAARDAGIRLEEGDGHA